MTRPPLLLGTFVTPLNSPPEFAVDRAVLAEELGFDLVTFQDHPYQPRFHDTWTLLTWVAARTTRVQLAANVHNVPMRPPAVLARAAASLDLLSGGRVNLALGAGAFWDAMAAMGVERLTPGESLQAFREALDVIAGIWNVDDRAPLRVEGRFHHLNGAKRGPAPAHDIPIWVGAVGPRMQALTGERADGWLPSLAYVGLDGLRAGNARIDDAARRSGREPDDIRRLLNVEGRFSPVESGFLNGPASLWVEQLADLATVDGISAFILSTDDAETLRRFAAEVAPELRDRLAAV